MVNVILVGAFDVVVVVVVVVFVPVVVVVVPVVVVVAVLFDWVVFTLWVVRPSRVAAMEKEKYFM